jgi:hypothetical protein
MMMLPLGYDLYQNKSTLAAFSKAVLSPAENAVLQVPDSSGFAGRKVQNRVHIGI